MKEVHLEGIHILVVPRIRNNSMDTNWCIVCDKKTGDELYCTVDCFRKDIAQMTKPEGNDHSYLSNLEASAITTMSWICGKPINIPSSMFPSSNPQLSITTTTTTTWATTTTPTTTTTTTTSLSSITHQDESRPRILPRRRGLSFMQELQCERQQERWRRLNYPNHMSAVSTK